MLDDGKGQNPQKSGDNSHETSSSGRPSSLALDGGRSTCRGISRMPPSELPPMVNPQDCLTVYRQVCPAGAGPFPLRWSGGSDRAMHFAVDGRTSCRALAIAQPREPVALHLEGLASSPRSAFRSEFRIGPFVAKNSGAALARPQNLVAEGLEMSAHPRSGQGDSDPSQDLA